MQERYFLNRRHALCCGAAAVAGLFTSLRAHAALPGIDNPCRGKLPEALGEVLQLDAHVSFFAEQATGV